MKQQKTKIKYLQRIEDMATFKGGSDPTTPQRPGDDTGCWCTCNCFEATVSGYQLGTMGGVSSGQLENSKCSGILASIWGL